MPVLSSAFRRERVTSSAIDAAKAWPLNFVVVLVAVVSMLYVAYWILHYGFGYDQMTVMLGRFPR